MVGDNLPQGWQWTTVEKVQKPNSKAIVSGPFGSNIGTRFFVESGIPVIRGNNLTTDMRRFIDDGFVFITEEKAQELKNCEAYPNDLIFTAAGTLGQVGIIPPNSRYPRYIISNKQMRARLDENLILPIFAFYWLSSPEMVEYIEQRNTGSSVPLINLTVLRQLPIPLPPKKEQEKIARILGALDEKIELNRRINHTLEEMASALFKSWFMDFDPVTQKAEGRTPFGMNANIATLFPSAFQETQLGAIPIGWSIGRLDDLLVLQRGFDLPTPKRIPGNYPILAASGYSGTHNEFKVKGPGVTTGRSGVIGKVFFVHDDYWPLNTSLWVKEFKLAKPIFAYHLLETLDFETFNAGSAVPTLNRNHVHNLPVVIPPSDVISAYENIAIPLFRRSHQNGIESRMLATIRDGLMLKLLSGELRVKQAEKVIKNI
ncbi:MAG: restriction endonuclease subunit S [Anaerolineales bacterium]